MLVKINIDMSNVADEGFGDISFAAPYVREALDGSIITTDPHTPSLTDGIGYVELHPGPVEVSWENFFLTCEVPETGPITLAELLMMSRLADGRSKDELLELVREVMEGVTTVREAASSAVWDGDRLTVLDVTSPPLTGPPGEVSWDELNAALEAHTPRILVVENLDGTPIPGVIYLSPEKP